MGASWAQVYSSLCPMMGPPGQLDNLVRSSFLGAVVGSWLAPDIQATVRSGRDEHHEFLAPWCFCEDCGGAADVWVSSVGPWSAKLARVACRPDLQKLFLGNFAFLARCNNPPTLGSFLSSTHKWRNERDRPPQRLPALRGPKSPKKSSSMERNL